MTGPSGSATASSSLMYNYLAATSIDATFPIASAEDQGSNPILFTVGDSDTKGAGKTLWVTLRDATVPAGWRRVSCTPDSTRNITAYAIAQTPQGTIIVVVAIDDGAGGNKVFVSPKMTPLTDGSPWQSLNSHWVERTGAPSGEPVQRFVMGDYPDDSESPLLIAEVKSKAGTITRYFIDASTSAGNAWSLWSPPQDVTTLHDVVVGRVGANGQYHRGTWTLYEDNAKSLKLFFTGLLDENLHSYTKLVTPPSGARRLAALPDSDGVTNLYVGGDSLSVFLSHDLAAFNSKAQTISTELSGITSLLACQDSEKVSIWAVDSSQNLHYTSNSHGSDGEWPSPLLMRQHVAQITPRRNTRRLANEIFLTTSDNSTISYIWQDPDSTSWQNSDVSLPALSQTQEFACYTTVARFLDSEGRPLVNADVRVSSSEWTWALANGYWMALDNSNQPVSLKTDQVGTITIINKISDLGTPVYRFAADFLSSDLLADPGSEIRTNLARKLSQSGGLSSCKRADGSPVIPPGTDPDLIAQIQASLQQLLDAAPDLPADGSPVQDTGADTPAVAESTAFAVVPTAMPALVTEGPVSGILSEIGDAIETAAGDVLQALEAAGEAIYEYVIQPVAQGVKGVLQFFVKIGEKVLTFVIRTLSELMQVISWLFQQLALLIKDLIELLGFLFSWGDILDTHDVLRQASLNCLDQVEISLKGAGPQIESFFNDLIAQLPGIANSPVLATYGDTNLATVMSTAPDSGQSQAATTASDFSNSPAGSFTNYQLAHGGITQASPNIGDDIVQAVSDFLNTIIQVGKDVGDGVEFLIKGIINLFQSGQLTLKNLAVLLLDDVVATILASIRDLLVGGCNIIGDLVELAKDVMTKVIEIPLLSGLYRLISGGSDPTLLDGMALLLAIPSTVAYKLVRGEAPFPDGKMPGFLASSQATAESVAAIPGAKFASSQPIMAFEAPESTQPDFVFFPNLPNDPGYKTYSQIGAFVSMFSSLGILCTAPVGLIAADDGVDSVAAVAGGIEAALLLVSCSTAFPADDAPYQQKIDRGKWMLDVFTALIACAATRCAYKAIKDPVNKPSATLASNALSVMSIIDGGYGLIAAPVSYIMELVVVFGDDVPDYHGFFLDSAKLVSNLSLDAGTVAEAAGTISYQDYLVAITIVGYFIYFTANSVRAFYILSEDLVYQPT